MEQGKVEEEMQQNLNSVSLNSSILFPSQPHHFDPSASADDDFFLDQMLSTLAPPSPSWPTPDHLRLHHISPSAEHFFPPDAPFKSLLHLDGIGGGGSVETLYNGFDTGGNGSLQGIGQAAATLTNQTSPSFGSQATTNEGGAAAQPRQRVRARRGQATDPHSIAERLRRERIAERMKSLQELVPNANKTDKASMLDEIIDYVKFLQLQVKVLSMSRLGGGCPSSVAPLVADLSFEGGGGGGGGGVPVNNGGQPNSKNGGGNGNLMATEHQVAKLMEEDMGSAMHYLQVKGLCLMPISLATAISTVTSQSRAAAKPPPPSSPGASALTAQSAATNDTA